MAAKTLVPDPDEDPQLPADASRPARGAQREEIFPEERKHPERVARPTLAELAQAAQDAEALELRRRYYSYPQIARAMNLSSAQVARGAVHRAAERLRVLHEDDEEGIAIELARYDELARECWKIYEHTTYLISNSGHIIEDPATGKPLADMAPKLQAIDRLITISRERRRIQALDKPATTRVEVRTVDAVDGEIERLLNLLADAGDTTRRQITDAQIVDAEIVEPGPEQ